jgi:hypothetical protein|tara:strand:- start:817 stop:978 length:162 start_codon:yes stop_codon:yes gene_type:complete
MKLRREDEQVFLKKTENKRTPRLDLESERVLQIELRRLGLPPKKTKDGVIAPG